MPENFAVKLGGAAKAQVEAKSPRLVPVATGTHFPIQLSNNLATAGTQFSFRTTHHFPKGGSNIRLYFTSVAAGFNETPTSTGYPLKISVSIDPAPWDAAEAYQSGDQVTWYATQGGGAYNSNPFYVALTSNTNSPPAPGNSNWGPGTRPMPVPVTVNGTQDSTFGTQTLPDGTTVAKPIVESDVLPISVPAGGWLGIYSWLPMTGTQITALSDQSQNPVLGPLIATGASIPDRTNTQSTSGWSSGSSNSVQMRPVAIIGRPIISTEAVAIIGDSIATGKIGSGNVQTCSIVSGGSGYSAGDILTIPNTGATAGAVSAGSAARVIVDSVSSGVITALRVIDGGGYSGTINQTGQVLPNGMQALVGGTGTGASCTLTFGTGGYDNGDMLGGQGYIERALHLAGTPYVAFASAGDRVNLWRPGLANARSLTRLSLIAKSGATRAIIALGRNDLSAGDSASTILSNLQWLAQALKGLGIMKVAVATVTMETTSTTSAGQSTLSDQNITSNNAARLTLNASLRTSWQSLGFDELIDVAAAVENGGKVAPTGKWDPITVNGVLMPAAADGKHPGPACITQKMVPVVADALLALGL
jgi:hypothetical protein